MTILRRRLATSIVLPLCLLGGCAQSPVAVARNDPPLPARGTTHDIPVKGTVREPVQIAALELNDQALGTIRGGFDASPGVVITFGFQQATYLNNNLVQTIVVPTLTVTRDAAKFARPATGTAAPPTMPAGAGPPAVVSAGAPVVLRDSAGTAISINGMPAQVGPLTAVAQASANMGMTSVLSSLGSGGLLSLIQNRADGQLIQQATTMSIGISGLAQLLTVGNSAAVAERLAISNAMLR